jgi:hypothetical protein
MGLFDLLKKKGKSKVKELVSTSNSLDIVKYSIHEDIKNLLWFKNGPRKNFESKKNINSEKFNAGGYEFTIEFSMSTDIEPSLIDTNLTISELNSSSKVKKLPYYPSYEGIDPEQRGAYLKFLSNPYNKHFEIGYVFLLYYGLERFLLTDKFVEAFEVILKLRDVHENSSFQSYSGNALVLSCLYHQRPDMMLKFIKSLDKDYELNFSDNLFLLSAYSFDIPIYSKDITRLAKTFEFTNNNYIKKYPNLFDETMNEILSDEFGDNSIKISDLLSEKEFKKLRNENIPMFANISISDKKIKTPLISESFKLKKTFNDILIKTHETVKEKLVELRKKGKAPEVKKNKKATKKEVLVFDEKEEKRLLKDLKKNFNDPFSRHYTYIELQKFYYKYRKIDDKYVDECIKYCEDDLKTLNDFQQAYMDTELKRLKQSSKYLSKKEIKEEKENIYKGYPVTIPAFKRLAIIHEKNKDYEKAISVCEKAIVYYNNAGVDNSEFIKRKEKLESKI